MQIFTRALGVTEAELFKMMEAGQLVSAEVLPKVAKEFRKAAKEGGAYALALQGLRVKEGQFMTGMQRAGKTIFNSGFEKGLSNLYGTLSEIFENAGPQLKKLGKIFGDVFNAIAVGLKIIEPFVKLAIDNFYTLVGVKSLFMLRAFAAGVTTQSLIIAKAWARMFAPLTAGLAALDEIYAMMDDNKLGLLERQYGKQVNLIEGTTTEFEERDGKFFTKSETTKDFLGGGNMKRFSDINSVLQAATNPLHSENISSIKDFFTTGTVPSINNYTAYNTFHNTQADDVKRAVGANVSVAQQPKGK